MQRSACQSKTASFGATQTRRNSEDIPTASSTPSCGNQNTLSAKFLVQFLMWFLLSVGYLRCCSYIANKCPSERGMRSASSSWSSRRSNERPDGQPNFEMVSRAFSLANRARFELLKSSMVAPDNAYPQMTSAFVPYKYPVSSGLFFSTPLFSSCCFSSRAHPSAVIANISLLDSFTASSLQRLHCTLLFEPPSSPFLFWTLSPNHLRCHARPLEAN